VRPLHMRSTPLRSTPIRHTLMICTLIRYPSRRHMPMRCTFMKKRGRIDRAPEIQKATCAKAALPRHCREPCCNRYTPFGGYSGTGIAKGRPRTTRQRRGQLASLNTTSTPNPHYGQNAAVLLGRTCAFTLSPIPRNTKSLDFTHVANPAGL
jgi:hypothetical protein